MRNEKISFGQFAAAAAVASFSPISRLLPHSGLKLAGKGCWIGVGLAFLPALALCFAARSLLAGENRGLMGALEHTLGKTCGRIAALLSGLWITFYGGFVIRSGAERYLSTVYKSGKLWVFVLTIAATALVAALGRIDSAARMAQVSAAILGASLGLITAMGVPELDKHYLLPPEADNIGGTAASTLPVLNAAMSWTLLCFLSGYVRPERGWKKKTFRWLAFVMFVAVVVTVMTVGVLGPELAESQRYPFYVLISNLELFDILEHVEPVMVMIWVLTDFVFVAILMMSAGEIGRGFVKAGGRKWAVLLSAAMMVTAAFCMSDNSFDFAIWSENIVPCINLAFSGIFIPILAIIKKSKKDEKRC